jgi:hypothetical protein
LDRRSLFLGKKRGTISADGSPNSRVSHFFSGRGGPPSSQDHKPYTPSPPELARMPPHSLSATQALDNCLS